MNDHFLKMADAGGLKYSRVFEIKSVTCVVSSAAMDKAAADVLGFLFAGGAQLAVKSAKGPEEEQRLAASETQKTFKEQRTAGVSPDDLQIRLRGTDGPKIFPLKEESRSIKSGEKLELGLVLPLPDALPVLAITLVDHDSVSADDMLGFVAILVDKSQKPYSETWGEEYNVSNPKEGSVYKIDIEIRPK